MLANYTAAGGEEEVGGTCPTEDLPGQIPWEGCEGLCSLEGRKAESSIMKLTHVSLDKSQHIEKNEFERNEMIIICPMIVSLFLLQASAFSNNLPFIMLTH